ncbi:HupE/UreJ family protein [Microbacterium allomyrinae]|uniref:HupE/UreJ family protein n=1 Tax=Microbacterium allomyrinae TaxID=2830666 RepID=A0A9X1LWA2_9MICO|nr:HupE/UreJ family protein [Microbacterium allomyrinae]MCC2032630.1 HupE/UreJ family protein [Microbacterium allomyrinae]
MLSVLPRLTRPLLIALVVVFASILVLVPVQGASAHPAGTTGVFVTVQADAVDVEMQIHKAGFVAATGYDIETDQTELDAIADNLMTFILNRVTVSDDTSALEPTVTEAPEFTTVNGEDAIVTTVRFADGGRAIDGEVVLDYDFILDVVPAHQVYVALVSDWNNGQLVEGDPEVVGVLGGGVTEITLDRSALTPLHGFFAVVWLGMLHIAEGTDHLLFLATLLVVAPSIAVRARRGYRWEQPIPLKSSLMRALLIITSFTAGHLVTLALVSLGVISFPTKPVEILVAVSIVVAAIHAFRPIVPRGELLIAGVFGLVHGTAFATTILDLNLGFGEKLVAILGFNIGVELAQLTAAVLVLPLLIWLSHSRAYAGFRNGVAVVAIVAATAWIVGIGTDNDSILQPAFDQIAHFPIASYLALVALVAGLWYFTRIRRTPIEA